MGLLGGLGESLGKSLSEAASEGIGRLARTGEHGENAAGAVLNFGGQAREAFDGLATLWNKTATSSRSLLSKFVPELVDHPEIGMDRIDMRSKLAAGDAVDQVHQILEPFRLKGGLRNALSNRYDQNHMSTIVDIIENGGIVPNGVNATADHVNAANQLTELLGSYGDRAEKLGLSVFSAGGYTRKYNSMMADLVGQGMPEEDAHVLARQAATKAAKRPFQSLENYFPHYFDENTIQSYLAGGAKNEGKIQEIIDRGFARDRHEAQAFLTRMLRAPGEMRGGPLFNARDGLNLDGYDKDIVNVMTRYLLQSERQLQIAQAHGTDGQIATNAILGRVKGTAYQKAALNIYKSWRGDVDPTFSGLARFTSTFHSLTLLSTAGIVQPAQLSNTAARIGWGNTLKAMASVAKDWRAAKLMAGRDGVLFDNIHNSLVPNTFGGISEKWGDLIGLNTLDRYDRVVSAVGGKMWANEQAKRLATASPQELARITNQFTRMGIDVGEVIGRGGQLTDDELRKAGLFTATNTQFASSVLDLPEMKQSPQGRFLYLFKSFALQQSRFIKDEVIKPAIQQGDYRPAIAFAAGNTAAAAILPDLIRKLKNREIPEDKREAALEDFGMVGGFGMFFDAFRAMSGGPDALFPWVLGPTAGEAARFIGADLPPIGAGIWNGEGPDFHPIVKHFASRVPGVGSWLNKAME